MADQERNAQRGNDGFTGRGYTEAHSAVRYSQLMQLNDNTINNSDNIIL